MTGIYGTRSTFRWNAPPGKLDPLNLRSIFKSENQWDIPDLQPCDFVPASLAAWNHPKSCESAANTGAIHFFLDDYRFERVWWKPEAVLPRLQEVGTALTPDFSIWRDMPMATQLWQVYRSRWCGAYWQSHGLRVIPTATWAGPSTYEFAFTTLPKRSVVAVSALGVRDREARALFQAGLEALIEICTPSLLLSYGKLPVECSSPVREYPKFWDVRREQIGPDLHVHDAAQNGPTFKGD